MTVFLKFIIKTRQLDSLRLVSSRPVGYQQHSALLTNEFRAPVCLVLLTSEQRHTGVNVSADGIERELHKGRPVMQ